MPRLFDDIFDVGGGDDLFDLGGGENLFDLPEPGEGGIPQGALMPAIRPALRGALLGALDIDDEEH